MYVCVWVTEMFVKNIVYSELAWIYKAFININASILSSCGAVRSLTAYNALGHDLWLYRQREVDDILTVSAAITMDPCNGRTAVFLTC